MPFVALCVPGHRLHVVWITVAVLGVLVHMMIEVVDVRVRIEVTKAIFSLYQQLFDFCRRKI